MDTPNSGEKETVKKIVKKTKYIGTPPISEEKTSDSKSSEKSKDPKSERLKTVISNVKGQKRKLEDIEKGQERIEKKIKRIKKEINDWMQKTEKQKLIWNNRSFHTFTCATLKRTEPGDILEILEKMYGEDVLEKVVKELEKLHATKYDGQYDVRFLSNEENEKKHRKKSEKTSDIKSSKKKKLSLIL